MIEESMIRLFEGKTFSRSVVKSLNDEVDAHSVFELAMPIATPLALPALFPWSGSSAGIVGGDGDLRGSFTLDPFRVVSKHLRLLIRTQDL
jgi:hypothetical protein